VNATYNVSYRSLLETDVAGRGYTPMLQTAVLIASFIVIWPIFCDKVNIFHIVVINGNIIQTLSQTSSYDRKKHHNSYLLYFVLNDQFALV
jgi:hypothetical protein